MSRIWNEKFESASYDETWSTGEVIGTGPTIVEDTAVPPEAPATWGSQCLEITFVDTQDSYVRHDFSNETVYYYRFEFSIQSEGLANNDRNQLLSVHSGNGSITATRVNVIQTGAGALELEINIKHDGGDNLFTVGISLATVYRVEVKWDTVADTWAWKLDGVLQNSGSLTGDPASVPWDLTLFLCGGNSSRVTNDMVVDYDLIAVDDADWVGAEGVHNDSTSDGASAGDSVSAVLDPAIASITDDAIAGETKTGAVDVPVSTTDDAISGDTPTAILDPAVGATTDDAVAGDTKAGTVEAGGVKEESTSDSGSAGDAQTATLDPAVGSLTDDAISGDTQAAVLDPAVAAIIDDLIAGDSKTGLADFPRATTDDGIAGDTAASALERAGSTADGATAGDAATEVLEAAGIASDGATASDSVSAIIEAVAATTDGATASDSKVGNVDFLVTILDGAQVADTTIGVASIDAIPGLTIVLPERKTSITVDRQWSMELPERITSIVVDP